MTEKKMYTSVDVKEIESNIKKVMLVIPVDIENKQVLEVMHWISALATVSEKLIEITERKFQEQKHKFE